MYIIKLNKIKSLFFSLLNFKEIKINVLEE